MNCKRATIGRKGACYCAPAPGDRRPAGGGTHVRALLILGAAVAALSTAAASSATTAPAKKVNVTVRISDKGIKTFWFLELDANEFTPLAGAVPRGDSLTFTVVNRGRRVHDFTVLGKKTPRLEPGQQARLTAFAIVRGRFPYTSTL